MTRWGVSIVALISAVGCAHQAKPQPVVVVYEDRPAAALAYAPPVVDYSMPLAVVTDRDSRQQRAFFGYDSGVTEYYWLRTDDRIRFGGGYYGGGYYGGGGNFDRYERRAVSTRVGVIQR